MEKEKADEYGIRAILAANVQRLRKASDLSQLDLSKLTKLTHNFINDIENENKGISLETIGKLSKALKVEPYQLFLTPKQWDGAEKYQLIGVIEALNKNVNRLFKYSIQELHENKGDAEVTQAANIW